MGLRYDDLDEATRSGMIREIDMDVEIGHFYLSNYLNEVGCNLWIKLLRASANEGSDDTLAVELNKIGCLKEKTERRKPSGGYTLVSVPYTAAQTLAEAQFNLYYMRALADRAIKGKREIVVYRARNSENPRRESEQMIGKKLDPEAVLHALRETLGVNPSIGIPLPNSGITIKLL